MILTKEQIDQLDYESSQKALRKLARTYKLDQSIQKYLTPELWLQLDDIVNTLLWLEDRIKQFEDLRFTSMNQNEKTTATVVNS